MQNEWSIGFFGSKKLVGDQVTFCTMYVHSTMRPAAASAGHGATYIVADDVMLCILANYPCSSLYVVLF